MGGVNLYAYVGGDPVNAIDSNGQMPIQIVTGITGGVVGIIGNIIGQLMSNGWKFECIKLKNAFIAGGIGAVTGAIAPSVAFNNIRATLLGSSSNMAQYWATQYANGEMATMEGFVWNAVSGAVGGRIGGPVSKSKNMPYDENIKQMNSELAKRINDKERAAANVARGTLAKNLVGSIIGNQDKPGSTPPECGCE